MKLNTTPKYTQSVEVIGTKHLHFWHSETRERPATAKETGVRRLQTKREYFEYEDRSLMASFCDGLVQVRPTGMQSCSWSVVEERNPDDHSITRVRNGSYCEPYWWSGAWKGDEQHRNPDYYLICLRTNTGEYERYQHASDLDEAISMARRFATQVCAELQIPYTGMDKPIRDKQTTRKPMELVVSRRVIRNGQVHTVQVKTA